MVIGEDIIKTDEIFAVVEARRASKWHSRYSNFYDGLYHIAKMQEFHYEHITGFHYGEYTGLWNRYTDELYLMDTYYRRLHTAFRRSLTDRSGELDDMFKKAASTAEKLYKNWYLTELNGQWCSLIDEDVKEGFALGCISKQKDLYNRSVQPLIKNDSRAFVIISDAFRYEIAAELAEKLTCETNGTAKLSAVQSVFPSVTKMGVAALLPHNRLTATNEGKVLCDGMPTDSTDARDRILKKVF